MSLAATIPNSSESPLRRDQICTELSLADFETLRSIVLQHTGISLNASKMELVKRRFLPRLRALHLHDFGEYVEYVKENFESEGVNFCNAITTNLTSFFREQHHFELVATMLRAMLARRDRKPARVRLWSAGCSAGQEAYSLAIMLRENFPDLDRLDIRILATDLDENCLNTARRGIYPQKEFEKMHEPLINRYFREVSSPGRTMPGRCFEADDGLKSLITFNKLNLMHTWPVKGPFEFILCRNVFIYFDKDTQLQILRKFAALQRPGSYLCLGHSEIIPNPPSLGYQMTGKTSYRRV
ncbi:MAG TPA: protein-glutamate O-methyltransferase CheR [Pseudomonadales bacterium]